MGSAVTGTDFGLSRARRAPGRRGVGHWRWVCVRETGGRGPRAPCPTRSRRALARLQRPKGSAGIRRPFLHTLMKARKRRTAGASWFLPPARPGGESLPHAPARDFPPPRFQNPSLWACLSPGDLSHQIQTPQVPCSPCQPLTGLCRSLPFHRGFQASDSFLPSPTKNKAPLRRARGRSHPPSPLNTASWRVASIVPVL